MIELRGVSKTVVSGPAPLTILHPLDLFVRGEAPLYPDELLGALMSEAET